MTKFQFISELLTYINLLLETDLTPCITSISQSCFDDIFENYEKYADDPKTPNTRDDLECYQHKVTNVLQKGCELYIEETPEDTCFSN